MWCSSFPEVPGRAKSPSFWRMCRVWLLAWIWGWKLLKAVIYCMNCASRAVEDNNHYNQSLWEICVDFSLNQRHKHKNRWNFALARFNRKSPLLLFFFSSWQNFADYNFPPVIKKISQSRASCSLDFSVCFNNGLCVLFLL